MERQEKARRVYELLLEAYGDPDWSRDGDPVDQLIGTILSANTNDINSARAFRQLKDRFGDDWDAVREAPLDEIKEAIRPAGMYNQKAPHIVKTLEMLKAEQGEYRLDHLENMGVEDALAYLTRFPGVGHKTASIVLLFSFNRGAFPVDTHVQRISQRLGISERKASAAAIKAIWEELLPPETYYALHVDLIRHGREICVARTPKCEVCPLQDVCDYYQGAGAWRGNAAG